MELRQSPFDADLVKGIDYLTLLGVTEASTMDEVVAAVRRQIDALDVVALGAELVEDQMLRLQRAADTLTGPDRDRYIALLNHFKGFERHQPDARPRFGF